jgi:Prokaryotic Cytochrome C oxidase subunit IV
MRTVVRTNASLIWFLLCALTIVSWALGTNHGFGGSNHLPASLVIFAVAIFKVRMVGLYFMELKMAPRVLRGLFEGYCLGLLGLLTAMFVFA